MSKKYEIYEDCSEQGDELLYQIYENGNKKDVTEEFYTKNDKKAKKYRDRFYGKKFSVRRIRVKFECEDIV